MMHVALRQEEVYSCAFFAPHYDLVAQPVGRARNCVKRHDGYLLSLTFPASAAILTIDKFTKTDPR
jgi:hypothetical protein